MVRRRSTIQYRFLVLRSTRKFAADHEPYCLNGSTLASLILIVAMARSAFHWRTVMIAGALPLTGRYRSVAGRWPDELDRVWHPVSLSPFVSVSSISLVVSSLRGHSLEERTLAITSLDGLDVAFFASERHPIENSRRFRGH